MDIEKAKESCKAYINAIDTFGTIDYKCINNLYEPIEVVLSELEKKEKQIDLMAEELENLKIAYFKKEDGGEFFGQYRTYNKNDWKQYFEKKVEGK